MKSGRMIFLIVGLLASLLMAIQAKAADKFPAKPLEIVVPYVAGGSTT